MSFNLTTSGACIAKAGRNANISAALLAGWCNLAESQVALLTHKDWVANMSSIKPNLSGALSDLVSDIVAMKIINWDMSGFSGKREAETMLDVLNDNMQRNIKAIADDKNKEGLII